jgi:hypothetical protein
MVNCSDCGPPGYYITLEVDTNNSEENYAIFWVNVIRARMLRTWAL